MYLASNRSPPLGLNTGIPRVGFCQTVPVPAYTVTRHRYDPYRTVNGAVSNETRGTNGTRGFLLLHPLCILAKSARTSIDVARVFREVLGG